METTRCCRCMSWWEEEEESMSSKRGRLAEDGNKVGAVWGWVLCFSGEGVGLDLGVGMGVGFGGRWVGNGYL
ncbi:unnamed protein product [Prunus armeniaca]|uniref:Uncharacterized protein n=1 Tax=Prunus armeniaca TaxID=36596 RepID=A0A6J5W2U8_PRUAR|nr:unnamed protein product [Prunus armeniaca]CAB4294064.1 unnamed protein product [Prunus armeniaca]